MCMTHFEVGNHLWVSRFSPHAFKQFVYVDGEWICSPEKYDIFQPPTRYVITSAYAENENSKKWSLELSATADVSFNTVTDVPFTERYNQSFVVAASLSGEISRQYPSVMTCDLNLHKVPGGVFETYNDFIITRKRSKNFQTLSRKLVKLQKQFQSDKKYKDMRLVTQCLTEIKTLAQVEKMMDNHPEYFL